MSDGKLNPGDYEVSSESDYSDEVQAALYKQFDDNVAAIEKLLGERIVVLCIADPHDPCVEMITSGDADSTINILKHALTSVGMAKQSELQSADENTVKH